MQILINNSDGVPIYEQILRQIKEMILSGELKEGDPLPSMRLLAQQLRISVITTKRAYEELEREGFIESFTGKGSFVRSKSSELIREANLKIIDESLAKACESAKKCGISADELKDIIDIIYND
ncbi:MAG: GntR family transcriptional regulator [Oscillospiraceae bacterium]|nr:GntR family transcriptional regulator [Oscillospiraceae bacterium]